MTCWLSNLHFYLTTKKSSCRCSEVHSLKFILRVRSVNEDLFKEICNENHKRKVKGKIIFQTHGKPGFHGRFSRCISRNSSWPMVGWRRLAMHMFIQNNYSYTVSHNHGSVKWLHLKGNSYWRDPFFTSMIMGGRVIV